MLSEEAFSRLTATVFRLDHSFKLPKHFSAPSRGIATAILSCVNEHGLVVGWYGTETTALSEVEVPFQEFQARCERIAGKVISNPWLYWTAGAVAGILHGMHKLYFASTGAD